MSTVIRTSKSKENPYVMLDKTGLNDSRLSWKAKGLLAYLVSMPDDWQIYVTDLVKRAKDGRDSIDAGLQELEKYGYLSRRQIRGESGKFGEMEYIVYEQPIEQDESAVSGKSPYGENTVSGKSVNGKSAHGKPATTNNQSLLNNKSTKKDDDDRSAIISKIFDRFKEKITQKQFDKVLERVLKLEVITDFEACLTTAVENQIKNKQAAAANTTQPERTGNKAKHKKPKPDIVKSSPSSPATDEELQRMLAKAKLLENGQHREPEKMEANEDSPF
jgi:hypothetical protein